MISTVQTPFPNRAAIDPNDWPIADDLDDGFLELHDPFASRRRAVFPFFARRRIQLERLVLDFVHACR
jgi:hypothetical protein